MNDPLLFGILLVLTGISFGILAIDNDLDKLVEVSRECTTEAAAK